MAEHCSPSPADSLCDISIAPPAPVWTSVMEYRRSRRHDRDRYRRPGTSHATNSTARLSQHSHCTATHQRFGRIAPYNCACCTASMEMIPPAHGWRKITLIKTGDLLSFEASSYLLKSTKRPLMLSDQGKTTRKDHELDTAEMDTSEKGRRYK